MTEETFAVEDLALPKRETERRILGKYLQDCSANNPLKLYVGSCPDYSHDGEYYTHRGIGGGVPLLTKKHLSVAEKLFANLERDELSYEYIVMVADVEAIDQVFCDKFTGGAQDRFLRLCDSSVIATKEYVTRMNTGLKHGVVRSSSFFGEFGRDMFVDIQHGYERVLQSIYDEEGSLYSRVESDTYARRDMYRAMYDVVLPEMDRRERKEFLIGRTIRTMAQYLSLGRLIGERGELSSIICHPTMNDGLFNDRNKYLLPSDSRKAPQPTIPVFGMKRRVY